MLSYKFPLYPNKEQQVLLWEHSCLLNSLYNRMLHMEQEEYEKNKKFLNFYTLNYMLPKLKQETPALRNIFSQSLQQVMKRVNDGYYLFFKKVTIHPPKFRSCKKFYNICYPQPKVGYKIEDNKFITKQYGTIEFNPYREMKGTVKTVSITHDVVRNKFYLCIVTDGKTEFTPYANAHIGIDLGTMNLVTTSDGEVYQGPVHQKYFDKQIDKLKSIRDTKYPLMKGEDGKKRSSRNRQHLNRVIAKLYGVKRNKTRDVLHKISRDLSRRYDTVMVEDLQVKRMGESNISGRNRELRNQGIGQFLTYLSYKCKKVVRVDPVNTSKTCCKCHHKIEELPLRIRQWTCPHCGTKLDRDRNAALNILHLGRAMMSRVYRNDKPNIADIDPYIWMDQDLYTAKELALVARPCSGSHQEAPSFR